MDSLNFYIRTVHLDTVKVYYSPTNAQVIVLKTILKFTLTFRHRASSIYDRHFATLQRTLFIYLINKYISLSDICLTVHH